MSRSLIRYQQLNQDVTDNIVTSAMSSVNSVLLPVHITGVETISGVKTFVYMPQISGGQLVATNVAGQNILLPIGISGVRVIADSNIEISGNSNINFNGLASVTASGIDVYIPQSGWLMNNLGNGVNVDVFNAILSGNWSTDTSPTLDNHIVNKGFVDNYSGILRTTGTQTATGQKNFNIITVNDVNNDNGFGFDFQAGIVGYGVGPGADRADFINRTLTGNWRTNTSPTQSTHLINLGYLTGAINGLSNAVYTTGNQTIYGNKTFGQRAAFGSGCNIGPISFCYPPLGDGYNIAEVNDSGNAINIYSGILHNIFDGIVRLDWFNRILSGAWIAQQIKISASGAPISYYNSGRATLTTGAADVVFPPMNPSTNILLTNQSGNGTPGWLRIVNRQNGVGFSIESSSATDTSLIYWEAKM